LTGYKPLELISPLSPRSVSELMRRIMKGTIFWSNIVDETSAREAAKQGWYASLCIAAMTIVGIFLGWTSAWSALDVMGISLVGFGCLKMSRVAAILGVILCILNGVDKYIVRHTIGMMPIFTLFFLNATRGTLEFHKLRKMRLEGNVTDQ
jgi:hypothetical protein